MKPTIDPFLFQIFVRSFRSSRPALLIHASFNLNRVCKTSTPMPLLLTYLMPEAASSFYTLLHVGKDANVISIDLTLVRRKWQSLSVRETGIFWAPLCTRLLCAPDTRHTYQIHLSLDHRAERGRREWSMCSQISLWMLGIVRECTRKRECLVSPRTG